VCQVVSEFAPRSSGVKDSRGCIFRMGECDEGCLTSPRPSDGWGGSLRHSLSPSRSSSVPFRGKALHFWRYQLAKVVTLQATFFSLALAMPWATSLLIS